MNWFQRYGIPGAYSIGYTIVLVYGLYPNWVILTIDFKLIIAIATITFIPIGYIISIFQQFLYLKWKCLGIHRTAMRQVGYNIPNPHDHEPIYEARSLLLILGKEESLDKQRYIQDWIRRRMDVIAINLSLIVAPLFSIIIAIFPILYYGWSPKLTSKVLPAIVIFIFVFSLMCWSRKILSNQIIHVLTEMYRKIYIGI